MDTLAAQQLQEHGIRPSVQRLAIMSYLMEHRTHPTADDIYNALCGEIPTLSRTTVYNTLQLLDEHDAVTTLTIDSRTAHYDADLSPHSHFLCRRCGRITDVPLNHSVAQEPPTGYGDYTVEQVQIYYYGVCARCNRQAAQN